MNTVEFLFVLLVCALAAFVGYQVQLSSKNPELSTRVIRGYGSRKRIGGTLERIPEKGNTEGSIWPSLPM